MYDAIRPANFSLDVAPAAHIAAPTPKLHYVDLLWICCAAWLYNRSTAYPQQIHNKLQLIERLKQIRNKMYDESNKRSNSISSLWIRCTTYRRYNNGCRQGEIHKLYSRTTLLQLLQQAYDKSTTFRHVHSRLHNKSATNRGNGVFLAVPSLTTPTNEDCRRRGTSV